jgi:hypothetical protein
MRQILFFLMFLLNFHLKLTFFVEKNQWKSRSIKQHILARVKIVISQFFISLVFHYSSIPSGVSELGIKLLTPNVVNFGSDEAGHDQFSKDYKFKTLSNQAWE